MNLLRLTNRCLLASILLAGSVVCGLAADPMDLVKEGKALNAEGKQDEAIALYRKALKASPNLYDAHLAAGIALDLKGQYADARHHLERAIELAKPENLTQARRTMVVSYAFEHDCAQATKLEKPLFTEQVAAESFTAAAETANELARICLEALDQNAAAKWYQIGYDTARKNPKLTDAEKDLWEFRYYNAQARVLVRRGLREEAHKYVIFAKSILDRGTNPDQARFYPYLAGYVALYSSELTTAIMELQKADVHDPFILVLIAQAYEYSNDKPKAEDYYRKVLAINTHNLSNALARPLAKSKLVSK